MNLETEKSVRTGYVSIVGRPNVGKSTLLNCFLEQKLSIVSRKPQTTRHQLLGIKTRPDAQIIFIDTPGLQQNPRQALNRYMNRQVSIAVAEIDVVLFVIEAMKWTELDKHVLTLLQQHHAGNVILVINKIDKVSNRAELLPYIEQVTSKLQCKEVLPLSARKCDGVPALEDIIVAQLPEGPALYPEDTITDRNERFFAAEFLREKLMNRLGDELPYRLTITIDEFKLVNEVYHIHACIWVEKPGQKSIVIGKQGKVLKAAGQEARKELEALFDRKVHLQTWVKVKRKWTESEQTLSQFGYDE